MNARHPHRADGSDRHHSNVRDINTGIPASVRVYDFGGGIDELFRSLLAPAMTFAVVILRGWYQGKKRWPARIIEATMFAIVAKILMPAAQAFYAQVIGAPPQVAYDYAFMTCIVLGFIGIDTLSEAAKNYFGGE